MSDDRKLTPEEIAECIVADLNRVISNRTADETAGAIATMIAGRFPETAKKPLEVKAVIRIANELMREHRIARGVDPSTGLRQIVPIVTTALDIDMPANEQPVCEIVDPREIYVDPEYQRDVTPRGKKKIEDIVERFDWNRFDPPKVTRVEHNGKVVLKCIDGQHTAIGCASHPGVNLIPVMVHKAPTVSAQADAFVGSNTGHLPMSPLQIHQAGIVAEDPEHLTIANVCAKAGVRVLKYPGDKWEAGDTVAIGCIAKLIDRRGARVAGDILGLLVRAEFAPINANDVRAGEFLLTAEEFRGKFKIGDLVDVMKNGKVELEKEARTFAATHGTVLFKAIARVWFQSSKKRKTPVTRVA